MDLFAIDEFVDLVVDIPNVLRDIDNILCGRTIRAHDEHAALPVRGYGGNGLGIGKTYTIGHGFFDSLGGSLRQTAPNPSLAQTALSRPFPASLQLAHLAPFVRHHDTRMTRRLQ